MKLTKRLIETTPPREKRLFPWDDELTGFGCRVHPGGRWPYVVRYRTAWDGSEIVALDVITGYVVAWSEPQRLGNGGRSPVRVSS